MTPLNTDGAQALSVETSEVNGRDMEVLRLIEQERLIDFTFEGLKRRIRTHPETLSRILNRLEEQSILVKASEGYRLTDKGRAFLKVHPLNATEPRITLLRTLLPPGVSLPQILSNLKGKWFGTLRWLGHSENSTETTLKWITEDGDVQVDARFSQQALTIEGKLLHEKNLADAIRASHQLVGHVARLYSRPRAREVLYFRVSEPYPVPN